MVKAAAFGEGVRRTIHRPKRRMRQSQVENTVSPTEVSHSATAAEGGGEQD